MMRIITGTARGTKLLSLEGEATRPTSERAKEAVFSMLAFEVANRHVLDLFAGSGQLALEALSRGARHATMVDSSRAAVEIILKNIIKTHMEGKAVALELDCAQFLCTVHPAQPFDLIFIDPPYALHLVPQMLNDILSRNLAAENAIFVWESEEEDIFDGNEALRAKFTVRRVSRYAKAVVTVLERRTGEEVFQ